MAYTRGNLAVQERQKETSSRYVEKTTVIKRRSQLPKREKLLYLFSVVVVVVIMGWIGMGQVRIYDLNRQIHQADNQMREVEKNVNLLQVKKQTLEMEIANVAKELGYVPIEDAKAIHLSGNVSSKN